MKRKYLYSIISLLVVYPIFSMIQVAAHLKSGTAPKVLENVINNYQISIWITWIFLVFIAVYYKWTAQKNTIFYFTYVYVLIANSFLGYYIQRLFTIFELESRFSDSYSLGVFTALQHIVAAGVLTAFLQAGVWWFTRRWHRR